MRHNDPPQWHQINIRFDDRQAAERCAFEHLGPVLTRAESAGLVTSWFFVRKQWWRFRYLPASGTSADEATKLLRDAASSMRDSGHAARWVEGVYEPETHAFGGDDATATAHDLFNADSRHIVAHLGPLRGAGPGGQVKRRELSVLLCTAMMRAAGQDRYEQGDIWAKVSGHRPIDNRAQPDRWSTFKASVQRLITVDTSPPTALRTGALEFADDWLRAFEHAGKTIRTLSDEGRLTRGIRAVAAHHVIFHWNRIGLPSQAQANIALAAKEAVFGA
jgi:thiopeptide-type bacteriocin biosynthesis protein